MGSGSSPTAPGAEPLSHVPHLPFPARRRHRRGRVRPGGVRGQLGRPGRAAPRRLRAGIRGLGRLAARRRALVRHRRLAPGSPSRRRRARRRGPLLGPHLHRLGRADHLPRRPPGLHRQRGAQLEHGPSARLCRHRGEGPRRPAAQSPRARPPLRSVGRHHPDPGMLRAARREAHRGRRRGLRRDVRGPLSGLDRLGWHPLLQRQQDHHDLRRRDAGDGRRRDGDAGAFPRHAGARPRAALPARDHRL